jgi:HB1, ASXL, restriction endonuclease HTH domain
MSKTTKKATQKKPATARAKAAPGPEEPAAAKAAPATTEGKLSALDAAAKVLAVAGTAMTCPQLIAVMAQKGYWSSPKGLTPAATLYSAILREVKTKGKESRFAKTERGKFALQR